MKKEENTELEAIKDIIMKDEDLLECFPEQLVPMIKDCTSIKSLLYLCGRNNGFDLLITMKLQNQISSDAFGKEFRDAWSSAEYPASYVGNYTPMLWQGIPRETLCGKDYGTFTNLPEKVTIYRGARKPKDVKGYSWTTDIKIAEFFAKRYGAAGIVATGVVKKEDIAFVSNDRDESEVVVDPKKVKIIAKKQMESDFV